MNTTELPSDKVIIYPGELTKKELEIMDAVRLGFSNKEISRKMNRSEYTIKAHLRSIYKKLQVGNRVGAVMKIQCHLQN
jgi:LuxR family maltose regulon positive regulatory protein